MQKASIMKERTKLFLIAGVFVAAYYVPWTHPVIRQSGLEAFMMLQEYAREHVLTCLIPADPGLFHRRRHRCLRLPGFGAQIFRRPGQ